MPVEIPIPVAAMPGSHRQQLPDPAIRQIKETLQGPVVDVFRETVPSLQGLGRDQAYNLIMGHPDLADHCFKLFRSRPDLFQAFLLGPDRRPVTDDDQPLRCGRTLAEVVALVVRAIAKRHFRAKLGHRGTEALAASPPSSPPSGLWDRLKSLLMPLPPPPTTRPRASRADRLYQALRDFLLYDWQVPLIPHYVPLPVPLVRQLGPRILEFRHPQQLRALALKGMAAADEEQPADDNPVEETDTAEAPQRRPSVEYAYAEAATPRAEAMWAACQQLNLAGLFEIDEQEMRSTIAHASAIGPLAMTALNSAGLRLRGAVVFLCTIDRQLGHAAMRALLGTNPSPDFLKAMVARARALGLARLSDPADIKVVTEHLLGDLRGQGYLSD